MSRLSVFIMLVVFGVGFNPSAQAAPLTTTLTTVTELKTVLQGEQGLSLIETIFGGVKAASVADATAGRVLMQSLMGVAPEANWRLKDQALMNEVLAKFREGIISNRKGADAKAQALFDVYRKADSSLTLARIRGASTEAKASRGQGITANVTRNTDAHAVLKWALQMIDTEENIQNGLAPEAAITQEEYNLLVEARDLLGTEVNKCLLELSADSSFANLVRVAVAGLYKRGMVQFEAMAERLGQLNGSPSTARGDLLALRNKNVCGLLSERVGLECLKDPVCASSPSRLSSMATANN